MALSADTLLDRLYLKSQLRRWRLFAVLSLVVAAVVVFDRHFAGSPIESNYIARLTIEGIIDDDPQRDELITELQENKKVKAVIVRIDTPGGTAVGGEELYKRLKALSEVKPVVAVMRTIATSAGYMTALGTNYILAREGTITGSIGVLMESVEVTDLAEKLGIKPIAIKSSPLKGTPSPLEKLTPEARAAIQSLIDDFYGVFVGMVVERRQLSREVVGKLADGRVYSGKQALDAKLIDAIGGEEEAHEWLIKEKKISEKIEIEDVKVPLPPLSLLQELTQSMASHLVPDLKGKLDGLLAIWHPSLN